MDKKLHAVLIHSLEVKMGQISFNFLLLLYAHKLSFTSISSDFINAACDFSSRKQ